MKLNGEFVVRQVVDEILAIPVGSTAMRFQGMILLNDVSRVIWEQLSEETDLQALVAAVTQRFDVSAQEAEADIRQFLDGLEKIGILA